MGFRMRVLYSDAVRAPADVEKELHAEHVEMDRVFAESDFVSLHVPLLPETRGLISSARLATMKPTAYLINTSRGPVVDEAALVAALEARKIAGAALDVYEKEPQIHPQLVGRKDVVLAPHIASASVETRTKMAVMAAENVIAALEGQRPPNALNPELARKLGARNFYFGDESHAAGDAQSRKIDHRGRKSSTCRGGAPSN